MNLPPEFLLFAPLIALLAYTVFGMTGFGSVVIAMPLLVQVLPLKFAVPLVLLLDGVLGLWAGARYRRLAHFREIALLLPFIVAGTLVGVGLLITLDEQLALGVLGIFVLGYGAYCLSRPMMSAQIARGCAAPLGFAGGVFGALYGTGGVIYVVYLARRIADKSELRATVAVVLTISVALRLVLFGYSGLLQQEGLIFAWLLLLPAGALGMWLGNRLHHKLPNTTVMRVVYVLLVFSGVLLLLRVLMTSGHLG